MRKNTKDLFHNVQIKYPVEPLYNIGWRILTWREYLKNELIEKMFGIGLWLYGFLSYINLVYFIIIPPFCYIRFGAETREYRTGRRVYYEIQ